MVHRRAYAVQERVDQKKPELCYAACNTASNTGASICNNEEHTTYYVEPTLIAYICPSIVLRHSLTLPKDPLPRVFTTTY